MYNIQRFIRNWCSEYIPGNMSTQCGHIRSRYVNLRVIDVLLVWSRYIRIVSGIVLQLYRSGRPADVWQNNLAFRYTSARNFATTYVHRRIRMRKVRMGKRRYRMRYFIKNLNPLLSAFITELACKILIGFFGFLFLVWIPSFFIVKGRLTYKIL